MSFLVAGYFNPDKILGRKSPPGELRYHPQISEDVLTECPLGVCVLLGLRRVKITQIFDECNKKILGHFRKLGLKLKQTNTFNPSLLFV
jgi:hypothetical protein